MADKPSIKLYSIGGLDLDSESSKIANEDYPLAYNMRNSVSYGNQEAVPCNMKGNVLIAYTLGKATYRCLGSYEDKQGTIFYFVWASDGNHKILRYYPNNTANNALGEIQSIVTFNFGWAQNERITGIDFIDEKYLNWTDSVKPRTIDADKANNTNKFKTWDLVIASSDTGPEGFNLSAIELSTGTVIAQTMIQLIGTRQEKLQDIADAINDNEGFLFPYFSAEACSCSVKITEKVANAYDFACSLPLYLVVPDNWYGLNLVDRFFDASYWIPTNEPTVQYGQDPKTLGNFVKDRVLFFRTAYVGRGYQYSKTSPVSLIPVNNQSCNEGQYNTFNYIDVNVNDPALLDPTIFVIIKKIGIYVQERNTGVWEKIFDFPFCELYDLVNGKQVFHYKYYGTEQLYSVPDTFINAQYDNVPIKANAQKFAQNRLTYSGITEGYNDPKCVEASITPSFGKVPQRQLFNCSFTIRITNPSNKTGLPVNDAGNYAMPHQVGFAKQLLLSGVLKGANVAGAVFRFPNSSYPVYGGCTKTNGNVFPIDQAGFMQQIPLGGFGLYVPGTNYYGIGRQVNNGGLAVDEFGAFNMSPAFIGAIAKYLNDGGDVYQTVTMKLPAGKHVIRMFSHLVSDGDVLKQGGIYDINQGLYGLTSTQVFCFADPDGNFLGDTEIVINVTEDANFGTVYVADRMVTAQEHFINRSVYGYLLDVQLFEVLGQKTNAIGVEKATMIMTLGGVFDDPTLPTNLQAATLVTYTDHNGFFFFNAEAGGAIVGADLLAKGANNVNIGLQTDAKYYGDVGQIYDNIQLTSNEIIYPGNLTYKQITQGGLNNTNVPLITTTLANDLIFQNQKDGTFYNVLGQQVAITQGAIDISQTCREVIMLNTSTIYRPNFSTVVEGKFVDQNGIPICCTTAVLTENGRPGKSDDEGDWTILSFADGRLPIGNGAPNGVWLPVSLNPLNAPATISQEIVFESGTCLAEFNQNPVPCVVSPLNANTNVQVNIPPYSSTSWFSLGNIICNLVSSTLIKAAKRGTSYDLVLRFEDGPGRQSSCVKAISDFYIPFFGEDLNKTFPDLFPPGTYSTGYPILQWSIPQNFQVPQWAARARWLRTKNKNQLDYLQWVINSVQYVQSVNPNTEGIIFTSYNNYNANLIWISIDNLPIYQEQNPNNDLTYQFQIGQRMRFIADPNGKYYQKYVDVVIQQIALDGSSLQVSYFNDLGEILPGMLVEIYDPNTKTEDAIYYECGSTIPCTNPGQPDNTLSSFNGTFVWGDTFWVLRNFPVRNDIGTALNENLLYFVESPMVSDNYPSLDQDIGRPGIIDVKFRQIYKYNAFRVSDPYLPDSGINGLSSFIDVDDISIGREFGAVRKLITTGFVLGAVCENKFVSNYLGAVEGAKPDGSLSIASQQGYINDSRPLLGDYGTQHPATIVEKDGHVWGADFLRGIVWEYSENGLEQIQKKKARNFFRNFMTTGVWDAVAAYDPFYEEYILSAWVNRNDKAFFALAQSPGLGLPFAYAFNVIDPLTYSVGQIVKVTFKDSETGESISQYGTISLISGTNVWVQLPSNSYNFTRNQVATITSQGQGYTIAYQKTKGRWTTFYNYLPDAMCGVGTNFVSWHNGGLYLHDNGPINTFYGVFYPWLLNLVATQPKLARQPIKVWTAMFIEQLEDTKDTVFSWSIPTITNELGQLSRLINSVFERLEQWWHTPFKKDLNTANIDNPITEGADLRSQTLTIQMTNNSKNKVELRGVDVIYQESSGNTK